jgi:hypothetical protein
MRRSSVTWLALTLLLSLALLAASSPDTNPEAAAKTEGTKTDGASAATKNVASDNHYKYRDGEYDGYEPDHEGYPWIEGHKKYDGDYKPDYYGGEGHKDYDGDKPDYYRGDSHLGHGKYGYPHKPKHHGYYPKPPPVVPVGHSIMHLLTQLDVCWHNAHMLPTLHGTGQLCSRH